MNRMQNGLFLILVFAILGMNSTPSWAGEINKAKAMAHFETATRHYEVQEYEKALTEYKAAYLAKPDPAFLFNIGQCYRKLGNNKKAQEFLKQFLNKAEPDDPNRANVEARIRDLETDQMLKEDLHREESRAAVRTTNTKPVQEPVTVSSNSAASLSESKGSNPFATLPSQELSPIQMNNPTTPASVPIYKTWWLWTGVGTVVLGVVVTTVLLSSGNETKIPPTTLGSQGAF